MHIGSVGPRLGESRSQSHGKVVQICLVSGQASEF